MSLRTLLLRFPLLVVAHAFLFALGSALFAPVIALPPDAPARNDPRTLLALLAVAVVDSALLTVLVRRSRLHGVKLAVIACAFFYFTKTFTSMLEAAYFMKNVTSAMLPGLFTMTLPLSIGLPSLAVLLLGRAHASSDPSLAHDESVPFRPFACGGIELFAKLAGLAFIAYPALFFLFGWFVAWSSPDLRAFYGGDANDIDFVAHFRAAFANDPDLMPFEMLRGALWVAAAVVVLRSTRGPWWQGTLLVALSFALIQNDVHWLPNPLMPASVRTAHFIETSTSNFLFACLIGALLGTSIRRRIDARTASSRPSSPSSSSSSSSPPSGPPRTITAR